MISEARRSPCFEQGINDFFTTSTGLKHHRIGIWLKLPADSAAKYLIRILDASSVTDSVIKAASVDQNCTASCTATPIPKVYVYCVQCLFMREAHAWSKRILKISEK
jgi:hypothetical protein